MRRRIATIAGLACLLLALAEGSLRAGAAPAAAEFIARQADGGEGPPGMASISARALGVHVAFLASPALAGRGLGSPGLEAAVEYAAAELAEAGIEPFGGEAESYFQNVPLRHLSDLAGDLEVVRDAGPGRAVVRRRFAAGADLRFAPRPPQSVSAPVVYAGLGIREPSLARDDYRGLDVRGKIVVVRGGLPDEPAWKAPELLARWWPEDPAERWSARLETAAERGAAALLVVETDLRRVTAPPDPDHEEGFFRPLEERAGEQPPLVQVSGAVAAELLAGRDAPGELAGTTATLRVAATERPLVARNVVGVLRGGDAARSVEAVVIGAHVDHLGRVAGVVHPGADDNASGVAALLEIARAFAAAPAPPRRTLVFALWTGEEEGKLGSRRYVGAPRWPLAGTVAYVNLDMIGHPWLPGEMRRLVADRALPDGETFLASLEPADFLEIGLPAGSAALEVALRGAAVANGMALHLDFTDGRHGGSDYRDFARAGIPFLRFFGDFHPDYHRPGDTAERLDAVQVERVARLAYAASWALANAD